MSLGSDPSTPFGSRRRVAGLAVLAADVETDVEGLKEQAPGLGCSVWLHWP